MNDKCDSVDRNHQENLMSQANTKGLSEAQGDLMVGDGDPLWLLNIISSLAGAEAADEKALLAYLYITMYESGFYFMDGPRNESLSYDVRVMRCLTDPQILLNQIKKENSQYVTVFSHNLIYPEVMKVVSYKLPTDGILVINFLLPNDSQVKTYMLNIKNYVSVEKCQVHLTVEKRSELTIFLKNALYLLKGDLSNETYHQHHILALPLHIIQQLCFYLNANCFIRFTATCKSLLEMFSEDEALWKFYSAIRFPGLNKKKNESWKNHFKYQLSVVEIFLRSKPLLYGWSTQARVSRTFR